jgi:plastocyanin
MQRPALVLAAACFASPALGADLRGTVNVGGKPAPHAVVWLDAPAAAPAPGRAHVVLDQRNLTFSPHVLVVRVGTAVEFPNNDKVFHNVFSFRDGRKFDLGMYPVGTSKTVVFDKAGLSRIYCNIHPNMAAYVMAVDTPFHAVSDQQGSFRIANVPPGTYAYYAWRPGGRVLHGSVIVDSNSSLEIRWN